MSNSESLKVKKKFSNTPRFLYTHYQQKRHPDIISNDDKLLFLGQDSEKVHVIERNAIDDYKGDQKIHIKKNFFSIKDISRNILRPKKQTKEIMKSETFNIQPKNKVDSDALVSQKQVDDFFDYLEHQSDFELKEKKKPATKDQLLQLTRKKPLIMRKFFAYFFVRKYGYSRIFVSKKFSLTMNQIHDALYCKKTIRKYEDLEKPKESHKNTYNFTKPQKDLITKMCQQQKKLITMKDIKSNSEKVLNRNDISGRQCRQALLKKYRYTEVHSWWSFTKRNCDYIKEYRIKFLEKIIEDFDDQALIISIDESSFSKTFTTKKCWVDKEFNKPLSSNFHKGTPFNVIGAITPLGVQGTLLVSGSSNAAIFTAFLGLIKEEVDTNFAYNKKICIVDGASIHFGEEVKLFLAANNDWKFLVTPPYSSFMQPVELLWNDIKYKIKVRVQKEDVLQYKAIEAQVSVKKELCLKFFLKMQKVYKDCLQYKNL